MGEVSLFPIRLEGLGERRELSAGPGAEPRSKTSSAHYICHRTHLVEEKFSLFIYNFAGTNKPTILRIS